MSAYKDYENRRKGEWVTHLVDRFCGHREEAEIYVPAYAGDAWDAWFDQWEQVQRQHRCRRCVARDGLSGEQGVGESEKGE